MAFIGLDRNIRDHWIYKDAEYLKVWIEILFCARYAGDPGKVMVEGQIVEIDFSQFIFGRIKWSDRLGISERRLRTLMDKLVAEDMIRLVKRAPKFSVFCVTNFAKFRPQNDHQETLEPQGISVISDQQNVQQATSKRPANDQQATTKEQGINKENKANKDIKYSVEFEEFWSNYPKQSGKPAAYNNFKKLLKKHTPDYVIACGRNYGSYCIANGVANQYMKMPNNFLNAKDEYYKQFETPFVIHNRTTSRYERTKSKLDQMLAEAEGRTDGEAGYYQTGTDRFG